MTTAHETSDAFNDATLREQTIFQYAKEAEMKEVLGDLADGQIEFYKAVRILQHTSITQRRSHDLAGNGRMGQSHTYHSAYPRGRLKFRIGILRVYYSIQEGLLALIWTLFSPLSAPL